MLKEFLETTEVQQPLESECGGDFPDDSGKLFQELELPDDSGSSLQRFELPDDSHLPQRTYFYDDNGSVYRIDNELKPESTYEINGYRYSTDDQGRIESAEGTLHMKDREGRLPIRDSIEDIGKGDQKANDDRGHLIGDQFDGSNGLENMIPQDANINRTDYRNFENELAKAVKDGEEVSVKVEPIYQDNSRRPTVICVCYSIDGEESIRIFPNGQEELI